MLDHAFNGVKVLLLQCSPHDFHNDNSMVFIVFVFVFQICAVAEHAGLIIGLHENNNFTVEGGVVVLHTDDGIVMMWVPP